MKVTTPAGQIIKANEYFKNVKSLVRFKIHRLNLANFFLGANIFYSLIFSFYWLSPKHLTVRSPIIVSFLATGLALVIALVLLKADIIDGWRVFKQNVWANLKIALTGLGLMFLGNLVFNLLMLKLKGTLTPPANETNISMIFQIDPLLMSILIALFAPILEELVFRNSLFRGTLDRAGFWPAILISSLVFGLMHVLPAVLAGDWSDLINIVIYMHMGVQMAWAYYRSGTIITPIIIHFLNNGFSLLVLMGLIA